MCKHHEIDCTGLNAVDHGLFTPPRVSAAGVECDRQGAEEMYNGIR